MLTGMADNSSDGTTVAVKKIAGKNSFLHFLIRSKKQLGAFAFLEGFLFNAYMILILN